MKKHDKTPEYNKLESLLVTLVAEQTRLQENNTFFKAALNIGNVYIVDIDTNTILFANDTLKEIFGNDIEGKTCYEVFHNSMTKCEFCTNNIIEHQPGVPYYWTHYNSETKSVYVIADIYIKYGFNGNAAHLRFEQAIPIDDKLQAELMQLWEKK